MKKRLLFYEILRYLSHKNALVITGMRQVGKTTLMRVEVKLPAPKTTMMPCGLSSLSKSCIQANNSLFLPE